MEKNIGEEIKRKHKEFDADLEAYLNIFRPNKTLPQGGISPVIQRLQEAASGLKAEGTKGMTYPDKSRTYAS